MNEFILVDTSVWIDFFRNGEQSQLEQLIKEDRVVTNDILLSKLIPALRLNNQKILIESIEAVPKIELNIDWQQLREYQYLNLKNGINKVGLPDLIIIQQVIHKELSLYSLDKHFKLMQSHLDFNLL